MTLSTIAPWKAHANIDLILLLASRASRRTSPFPLLVDLGPETSIVSAISDDDEDDDDGDDNTPAVEAPAEAPDKVLAVKKPTVVFAKSQVPIFNAWDITAILGNLDICISAPKVLWLDIPVSFYSFQVDVSMYPSRILQLESYINVSLVLLLAAKVTCCGSSFPFVVIGPSNTPIMEVASDDVEVWTDLNQMPVEENPEVILSRQNILAKVSAITAKPQVSTFSVRDIVGILRDLDICTPASEGVWLDLPGLSHGIRLNIPSLVLGATSQLGDRRVNVDAVLLLASMVTSRAFSFPRLVDIDTRSFIEVTPEGEVSIDADRTLIEDTCIPPIKKDPMVPPARTLNPNAAVFVPPVRLPPLDSNSNQESVNLPNNAEPEAPTPLSRRARARRLAVARKRRAQLSEIHTTPIKTPSTPAPACPSVYPSLNAPPPVPLAHAIGTMLALPAGHPPPVQPMQVPTPQSHYPSFPCAPPPHVYYGSGYRHPSRMPAPRPPRQMYLDAHRYLPPAFVPGNSPAPVYGGHI